MANKISQLTTSQFNNKTHKTPSQTDQADLCNIFRQGARRQHHPTGNQAAPLGPDGALPSPTITNYTPLKNAEPPLNTSALTRATSSTHLACSTDEDVIDGDSQCPVESVAGLVVLWSLDCGGAGGMLFVLCPRSRAIYSVIPLN